MSLYSRIEGSGKPLLIIHGFLGMSDNWKTLGGQYAERGFEVHALDMRNHGRSLQSDEFNYDLMVQDLYDYCKEHNLEKVDIIGHSMGGKISMFFAMTHPEMLEKLVVADIGPKYYRPHHQDILAGLNAIDFSVKPSRSDVEEILQQYIPDFGTRQFLMKNLYWVEQGQLAFRFNLKVLTEKIDNIGTALPEGTVYDGSVLFLRGDRSDYIKDQDFETIHNHFPKAIIKDIKNSGHWLHAENPKDFVAETLAFLTA
ncbi:alpha/beta fold hydrolase [Flavobacterium alkalisoli]|uniref:Alpha/beta fold hydrolase n=1 Tax=Flavobacterium alkalisoli TaxID=2602769 RepID=A0A5B9FMY2_9FLAO|nr:alpha/beta fold hydrolase [Flavobacterium alkalisoli]QEE48334.1 alpha/beta fold hydrolase [Flavobacterium alkalisoli]